MPNSTGLYQTLPAHARLCLVLFEPAESADSSRLRQNQRSQQSRQSRQSQQNQRTLIWLSILARTLALVQSLSLDSRMASSLWPYPPTIDMTLSIIVCGRG